MLLDVKRGDIGSTVQAYADAYLDPSSPLAVDAVTASPFLGIGSLDPLVDTALANERRGVRARADLQPRGAAGAARGDAGRPHRRRHVLDAVATRNAGAERMGSVGVVVGATIGDTTAEPRRQRPAAGAGLRRPGRHHRRHPGGLRRGHPLRHPEQLPRDPRGRPRRATALHHAIASLAWAADDVAGLATVANCTPCLSTPTTRLRRPARCRSRSHPSTRSDTSTTGRRSTPAWPSSVPRSLRSPATRGARDVRQHRRGAGAVGPARSTAPCVCSTNGQLDGDPEMRELESQLMPELSAHHDAILLDARAVRPHRRRARAPPRGRARPEQVRLVERLPPATSCAPAPRSATTSGAAAGAQRPDHHATTQFGATGCSPRPTRSRCTSATSRARRASPTTPSTRPLARPKERGVTGYLLPLVLPDHPAGDLVAAPTGTSAAGCTRPPPPAGCPAATATPGSWSARSPGCAPSGPRCSGSPTTPPTSSADQTAGTTEAVARHAR